MYDFFQIPASALPAVRAIKLKGMDVYQMNAQYSEASLAQFIDDFLAGKVSVRRL